MGNQLVTSVRTVIRPIDFYLNQMPDIKLKQSLGQTQFLKVAHCWRGTDDQVVVKVLPHEDPSVLLTECHKALLNFAKVTHGCSFIASFRILEIRSNFAFMIRQYVRYSLYDRLSTLPFLTDLEKYWIVYQIFRSMSWCHQRQLYHGDIKLENILVTSNLWVVITDFAPYKPVSLPEDDPTYFTYYFDTSRRRCCNIAPERFVSSSQVNNPLDNDQIGFYSFEDIKLNEKMDLFSIGCIIGEMFSDNVLFDLSNLLYYKDNKLDRLENNLKKIQNESVRDLVQNLINLDPSKRKSCDQNLNELKGVLFPEYFDQLYEIMQILVRLPPDFKIQYLIQEFKNYLPIILDENSNGVLLLLMTITASLRSLVHLYCKIEAQRLICKLVRMTTSSMSLFIIDRLIPYFVHLLSADPDQRARGEAICSITDLLEQVEIISAIDSDIFTDFLMPALNKCLETDKSVFVRLRIAQNIGRLSKVASSFIKQTCDHDIDRELSLLQDTFASLVVALLTDSDTSVRRALLFKSENSSQLCTFFGPQKTKDFMLTHIFTFLNHKHDFQLRLSFFDNVVVIASYLGVQCSNILFPLLQQGLCDAEEVIVARTIDSISFLTEQGLLQKSIIYDLLDEIFPLLCHPNYWIIHSIVNLLSEVSNYLSIIDIQCKVLPKLFPYLHREIHSLSSKHLILDSLNPPMSRRVLDIVFETKDGTALELLFEILQNKKSGLHNVLYKRLLCQSISSYTEGQLVKLSSLLLRVYRNRRNYLANQNREDCSNLIDCNFSKFFKSLNLKNSFKYIESNTSAANQEWQHMFGPRSKDISPYDPSIETLVSTCQEVKEVEYSYFDCPPCSRDLKELFNHKKNSVYPTLTKQSTIDTSLWKPKGLLISHLYEHKSSVNQLTKHNSSLLCTCSDDGTIRCWDLATFENRNVVNRSKSMFKMEFANGCPIHFRGIISCGNYIVTYTHDGNIYIFENNESTIVSVCNFKPGSSKSSPSLFITSLCVLSDNLFAVSLTNSYIYGYDVRLLHTTNFFVPAFKTRLSPDYRTINSMDGSHVVLCAGTSSGEISIFDLRFNLMVKSFNSSPNKKVMSRIARIKCTPSGLYTSAFGTSDVTLWDYKRGDKIQVLRTSKHQSDKSNTVMKAILPIEDHKGARAVLTAGSDFRIRYWDLHEPEHSFVVNDPSFKACSHLGKAYQSLQNAKSKQNAYFDYSSTMPPLATFISKQETDLHVIEELDISKNYDLKHFCSLDQQSVGSGHHDTITDLLQIKDYLISCSRDGTVKVWR